MATRLRTCTGDVGRYAAEQGIDVLIGVRGAACAMVEEARRAGMSDGAALFFEDPAEAGEFVRRLAAARRRGPVQGFARRAPSSGRWKGCWPEVACFITCFTNSSSRYVSPFRVFRYTTFRTAFASLTALFLCIVLGPWLIGKLRQFQIGQYIREEGPKSHQKKAGTPTMGGVLIIISIVVPTLLWADLRYPYVWVALAGAAGLRAGSASSTITPRSRKQRNLGLTGRRKLLYQFALGFVFAAMLLVMQRVRRFLHRR